LYLGAALRWEAGGLAVRTSPDLIYHNIFTAGLALTGFVVAQQVKRILAIGRYYEQRNDQ
jgi:hypothetical protein